MTTPTDRIVTFNGITWNNIDAGLLVPDDNGNYWAIEDIVGWDTPVYRSTTLDKLGRPGTTLAMLEQQMRSFTLTNGVCFSTSMDARYAAMDQLNAALLVDENIGPLELSVQETITRYAYCYVAQDHDLVILPGPGQLGGTLVPASAVWGFKFEAELVAYDPNRYNPSLTSPTTAAITSTTVTNEGTTDTWPLFTISGATAGDTVTVAGVTIFTVGFLPAPATLIVNCNTGLVTDGSGDNAIGYITGPNFVAGALSPGSNTVVYTTSGAGTCEIAYSSAWV